MHLTVCCCHVMHAFQSQSTIYSFLNVEKLLARRKREIWSLGDCKCALTQNHLIRKWTLNHLAQLAQWLSGIQILICTFHLIVCFCHVLYVFQSESARYSFLNVEELLAQSRRESSILSYFNWAGTQNHLVCKGTLNHLAKVAKWLSCVPSSYPCGTFDSMFLSCHVRVSLWIHILEAVTKSEVPKTASGLQRWTT